VVVVLAGRGDPVTGGTVVHDACVIEHCANKGAGIMTDTAILIGRHMGQRFADGEHIVMTGAAIIHDACMIERCRFEAGGHVAVIAILVGRHVVRWRGLAPGCRTIVARITVVNDTRVIESGIRK